MSAPMHQFEADTGKILDIVINSYIRKEIFPAGTYLECV